MLVYQGFCSLMLLCYRCSISFCISDVLFWSVEIFFLNFWFTLKFLLFIYLFMVFFNVGDFPYMSHGFLFFFKNPEVNMHNVKCIILTV